MGFYNTHNDWTYIQHKLLMSSTGANRRQIAAYNNDTGSTKIIKSVTLYLGVADGYVPNDAGGDALSANGQPTDVYLSVGDYNSNTVTVSNTCSPVSTSSGSWYDVGSTRAYTFTFESGPEIANGATVGILITVSSPNATDRGLVARRNRSVSTQYISGTVADPYKTPTISISSSTKISKHNENRSVWVNKNTSGDDKATTVKMFINSQSLSTNLGNGEGNVNFTPSTYGVSDGANYKVYATRTHNSNTNLSAKSNELSLYTYRIPKIQSFSITPVNFSGTGNATLKWSTNGRRWSDSEGEANFKTYIKFATDNTWFESSNNNPGQQTNNTLLEQTQALSKSILDSHITAKDRSKDSISTSIQVRRKNESSGVVADSSSIAVTIQFKPKYRPDTDTNLSHNPVSLIFKRNDSTGNQISAGSTIYIDECKKIYVQWTYPSLADGGVVNGYNIKIYDNNNTLVKTYTVGTSDKTANIIIPITDLKRGELNNIKITAYYNKPDGSGKLEGPSLDSKFILPLGKLNKPVIAYPINQTQWHNPNFRILFELPIDDDFDTYDTNIQNGGYRYKNIEVKINDTFIFAFANNTENMSSGAILCNEAFSTNTLKYKIRICINPSLVPNFPISSNYKIAVRVQKNYYKPIWSSWSDSDGKGAVNISQSSINWSTQHGVYILDTHFNQMRNWSIRLYNVYPIKPLDSNNKTVAKGDKILRTQYSSIYNTILGIQSGVNTYAIYDEDRQNIKFNQVINDLSDPNPITQELVTGEADPRPNPEGRNYITILVQCMNKLY